MTEAEARDLQVPACRHWRAGQSALLKFAVEMHQLKSGQVHRLEGYRSFGAYAERKFPDLSAASARHFAWMGKTLLFLHENAQLSLDADPLAVGQTAVRELASLAAVDGDLMLKVYERARSAKASSRPLTGADVRRAHASLSPPSPDPVPDAEPAVQDVHEDYEDEEDEWEIEEVLRTLHSTKDELDGMLNAAWEGELDADVQYDVRHAIDAVVERCRRIVRRLEGAAYEADVVVVDDDAADTTEPVGVRRLALAP